MLKLSHSLGSNFSFILKESLSQSKNGLKASCFISLKSKYSTASANEYNTKYNTSSNPEGRSFGFKNVNPQQHQSMVHEVFASVASKYDIMNDVMSLTTHRCWKKQMIEQTGYCRAVGEAKNATFLDVAGGTGDIAELIIGELSRRGLQSFYSTSASSNPNSTESQSKTQFQANPTENTSSSNPLNIETLEYFLNQPSSYGKVIISDINRHMLEEGKRRYASNYGTSSLVKGVPVHWFEANAEDLSKIPDNTIDGYSISFGIRNVTHIDKALKEAYRVLKPGGQFVCLEFSKVNNPLIGQVYDFYSYEIIPTMGSIIANDRESYQYLVESIRKFPDQETFLNMIQDAGFKNCYYENLTFGVVAIHHGFKV